ncbi:uncharacterized protein LOC109837450 isoform X3 [Asparagus officinalis]|uniref:uncharacterized protein LOC109837450 isoform X3 n=1 Tax=Asparagus officinalis TaxID=4686 RepID=UPI00098E53D0|nr:uncharacterized protein LOC109837450 isoform X3 [Asparagus officinalis]
MTMFFELNTGAKDPVVGLGTWQADAGGIRGVVIAVVKFHIITLYISIRKLPTIVNPRAPPRLRQILLRLLQRPLHRQPPIPLLHPLRLPCPLRRHHHRRHQVRIDRRAEGDQEEEFELVAGHRFADEGRGGIHAILPFDLGFCLFTFLRNGGLGFGWQWASSALKLGFCCEAY